MDIKGKILEIIGNNLERPGKVKPDDLLEDLGIDSLSMLMIINEIEDEFSLTIDEQDFADIESTAEIIAKLEAHLASKKENG